MQSVRLSRQPYSSGISSAEFRMETKKKKTHNDVNKENNFRQLQYEHLLESR